MDRSGRMSRVAHLSLSRSLVMSFVLVLYQDTGQGTTITSCGFESANLCNYYQRTNDQFDWTRRSGATPTADTGPSAAYEGSHYLYIETNSNSNGAQAIIMTRSLRLTGTACVSLAYHMYGEDIGTLTLWRFSPRLYLLNKTGNQGNAWFNYQERINNFVNPTTFLMEGVKGKGPKGDIAIDDFSVVTGTCKTTVPLPYSCSFESDLCDMWQTGSDDLDWIRTHISAPTPAIGSPGDSGGSWIISLASDGQDNTEVASIETPELNFDGDLCVRFKYYLSSNVSALRVYQDADSTSLAYIDSTATGSIWRSVSLTVRNFVRYQWITFSGRFGGRQAATMALDEISISTQICDDCAVGNGGCNQTCSRTDTGRTCSCRSGYVQFEETGCQDLDECASSAGCQQRCENVAGSYSCFCDPGYVLASDEHNCHDIDECSAGTDACSHECQNENGTYTCHCPDGWSLTGDGHACQDIDECATATDNECDHVCINVEGNYSCSCRDTYIRATDGRHCIECKSAYEKRVEASQLFTSDCPTTSSFTKISQDDCLMEACSAQTGVFAYFNMVCDLKQCDGSNLRLKIVSGSSGWAIYVLNTTWPGFIMGGDPGEPREGDGFPLVAVVAGVVVPVILLVVIVIAVVFIMRRRGSTREGDQSVQYVHGAGQPASVGEVRTPPINENQTEVGIYDEVTAIPGRQASASDTEATYKNAAFQGEGHYQDLGPGESQTPKHYDVIQ